MRLRINQMEGEIQPTPESTKGVEHVMPVERVTAPALAPVVPKMKDLKKVAAGRAGAAARHVGQESLLAERKRWWTRDRGLLRHVVWQRHRRNNNSLLRSNSQCMPLLLMWKPTGPLGSYLVELDLPRCMCSPCEHPCHWRSSRWACQQKQQHPEVGPPPHTPWCAQHLKVPDPFLME